MNKIRVYKARRNVLSVDFGFDITGSTITSEIRTQGGVLIATWTVAVVNAPAGLVTLTIDDSVSTSIAYKTGLMDFKRIVAGEPYAIVDYPIEVEFIEAVTA